MTFLSCCSTSATHALRYALRCYQDIIRRQPPHLPTNFRMVVADQFLRICLRGRCSNLIL